MENKYKKPVPKGEHISLLSEKIDLVKDPVWKHNDGYIQRFSEMSLNQLKYVLENCTMRLDKSHTSYLVFAEKLEQIVYEFELRNKTVSIPKHSPSNSKRLTSLKSFTDDDFLQELEIRLQSNKFFEKYLKVVEKIK